MQRVRDFLWELFHIFFRYYNFPSALGLIRVGNPDAKSPVFVSGNYILTVQRLLRKLRGTDCYLLVANSRGCNVWCAVGMNEFSEFDVIDAVTVARLQEVVRHRRLILPVYAAPGINIETVKERTEFNVHWGPTHLDDLPKYIENGLTRTAEMYHVHFGFQDRLEQALATGMAYSMTIGIGLIFWPFLVAKIIGMIFFCYLFAFCLYPVFPKEHRWRRAGSQGAVLLTGQVALGVWLGWSAAEFMLWAAVLIIILVLVALDECGSTPLYKTSIKHWLKKGDYKSLFNPIISPDLCINCMQCVLVCPKSVFAARRETEKTVVAVQPEECEECLACVKQCPTDAIFNRSGQYKGDVKSIPDLHRLVTRDWTHLAQENRWVGAPTLLRNGMPVVIEEANSASPDAHVRPDVAIATAELEAHR